MMLSCTLGFQGNGKPCHYLWQSLHVILVLGMLFIPAGGHMTTDKLT
jgi:hypothetical protein